METKSVQPEICVKALHPDSRTTPKAKPTSTALDQNLQITESELLRAVCHVKSPLCPPPLPCSNPTPLPHSRDLCLVFVRSSRRRFLIISLAVSGFLSLNFIRLAFNCNSSIMIVSPHDNLKDYVLPITIDFQINFTVIE